MKTVFTHAMLCLPVVGLVSCFAVNPTERMQQQQKYREAINILDCVERVEKYTKPDYNTCHIIVNK